MPFLKYRKHTKATKWEKLPPVPPQFNSGCLNCGLVHQELPKDALIAVGFGSAELIRDGRTIWYENPSDDEDWFTCEQAEAIAKENPDHDWRISYFGPLSEKEYQRQGDGLWILIRTGMGFA